MSDDGEREGFWTVVLAYPQLALIGLFFVAMAVSSVAGSCASCRLVESVEAPAPACRERRPLSGESCDAGQKVELVGDALVCRCGLAVVTGADGGAP